MEAPARALVTDDDGDVVGLVVERAGQPTRVGARKGVVLACGGFEWNPELVRAHIGYDVQPLSPPNNVGDGLVMAAHVGAQLANLNSYWGTPVMFDPEIERDGALVPQFEWGRGAPASIVVNRKGARFANEALPYNDFPKAFGVYDPDAIEFPNAASCVPGLRSQRARRPTHPVDDAGGAGSGLGAPRRLHRRARRRHRHRPGRARGDGRPLQRTRPPTVKTPTSVGTNAA